MPQVLVYFDSGNPIHKDFLKGLSDGLSATGSQGALELKKISAVRSKGSTDLQAHARSADLVVAVGSKLTELALDAALPTPLLSAMVPRLTYRHLVSRKSSHRNQKSSAVFLDQPISRLFSLALAIKPGISSVGTVLSRSNRVQRIALERVSRRHRIDVDIEIVGDGAKVSTAFKRLLEDSDVLIAVPDPVITDPSNAKWLLYMAYQRRVAVIGFSEAFAKAGAVASVYSTPVQIGRQTAKQLGVWSTRGWGAIAAPVAPTAFELATNPSVARALGLKLPSKKKLRALLPKTGGGDHD